MRTALWGLMLLAACSVQVQDPPGNLPVEEISLPKALIIVRIEGPRSVSSGSIYRSEKAPGGKWDNYVLTVDHAVRWGIDSLDLYFAHDQVSFLARYTDGTEVVYRNAAMDVAVIRFQSDYPCPELPITNRAPKFLERVASYGCPLGILPHITFGEAIRECNEVAGKKMWLTNSPIAPGNSGGPVVSLETGEILGITAMIFWKMQGGRELFFSHMHLFSPSFLFWPELQRAGLL